MRRPKPVFFRRPFRTASGLPQRVSQCGDFVVPKKRDAVFVPMHLVGMLVSVLGVFKSLPGEFLPGLVILFAVGFRSATMSVGGNIVQLSGLLMIFVM